MHPPVAGAAVTGVGALVVAGAADVAGAAVAGAGALVVAGVGAAPANGNQVPPASLHVASVVAHWWHGSDHAAT